MTGREVNGWLGGGRGVGSWRSHRDHRVRALSHRESTQRPLDFTPAATRPKIYFLDKV